MIRRCVCCRVVVAGILLASATVAAAQSADTPTQKPQVHLGPVLLTPTLSLKDFGVDTNVFNNRDQKHDFTLTVAPQVELRLPSTRRAAISATAGADGVFYKTYASERSLNPSVSMRGELLFNRLSLYVAPTYLRTRQRMNFELDARAARQERGSEAGFRLRTSPKLAFEGGGRTMTTDFDATTFDGTSLRQTLNRTTNSVFGAVRQEVTPLTSLVVRATADSSRFPLSPERDASSIEFTPGVEFKPRALLSGTAYVGVRRFTPQQAIVPSFTGAVVDASLAYTADVVRLSLRAERDLAYSYEPLQPYFINRGVGLTGQRRLIGRTDVTLGVLRYRYAYRNLLTGGTSDALPARVDTTQTVSTALGYRTLSGAHVGLGFTYQTRRSTDTTHSNYAGLRIMAVADYGF